MQDRQTQPIECRVAYSPAEFAALFGRHPTWGYRQLYRGTVKAITQCGRVMIPRTEVDRLVSSAEMYGCRKRSRRAKGDRGAEAR